ncbi:MAG TPA: GAF domain-containing protein, partial [Anaerolineales bacterium]|nr:GAF domain-containing protein [Anaerolineales bacterium]
MKNLKGSSAIIISLVYFVTGVLWILLTDRLLLFLFPSTEFLSTAQTYKGWFFILVTAAALYIVIKRTLSAQMEAERATLRVQESLMRRDAILKAVGYAAEQFLKSANWEDTIQPVLETLGRTTDVSRVYLFKKVKNGGEKTYVSQVHEWCDENTETQIGNDILQNISISEAGYKRWVDTFDQGLPLFGIVREFPEEEQALLNPQGILSLVCLPIPIGADWWGFIGFDECKSERKWTETEIEALRAAASTLGSAINRTQTEKALKDSEHSYRGLFNAVRDSIYIQDRNGFFLDVNEGASQMYGYPREYFIGKTPDHLSAPGRNDFKKILQAVEQAFDGVPQEFEFWGIRSNREVFPKEVRLFKGTYFGKEAVIAVSQDITARKEAETALQKQLRELSVLHAAALTEASARDTDLLIQHITNLIGNSLYSDNCGILLLNETGDLLIPHFSYRGANFKPAGKAIPVSKGVSGRVVMTRRPVRIGNVSLDPSYLEVSSETRSELCVPIISGPNILGVLNVESKRLNAFTERDERLLNTIAGGLANAIERIQLFELEKKRRQQAEVLREATRELTSFFDLEKLFEVTFNLLAKLVKYDSASIEILKNGQFTIVAGKDIPRKFIGTTYYADPSIWGGEEIP